MEYRPISSDKYEEAIQHLRIHFPDEPLNVCIGLCKKGEPCELLEHHNISTLEEGLSLMAIDPQTGEIAGVSLNGVSKVGDFEKALEETNHIDNIAYKRVFGLIFSTNSELNLFENYNVDKIFEIRILSVNTKYRGQGIGKQLCQRSLQLAEECGFKMLKVDATSNFSQRIVEGLGLKTEKAVRYGDFKDEEGKGIYTLPPPHEYYKVMLIELPRSSNN